MSRASKPHSTGKPDLVWLPDVFQEERRRICVDIETSSDDTIREAYRRGELDLEIDSQAEDSIREAHLQGPLDLKFQWLDGSFKNLNPHCGVWEDDPLTVGVPWRQTIRTGIVRVEYKPRWSRRRVPHEQPCRVYATRKSLDAHWAPDAPDGSATPTSVKDLRGFVAAYIKTTKDGGKTPTKLGLWNAAKGALPGATRAQLRGEFERQMAVATPGRGRPRENRQ
jgi:hypothetical protein